MNSNSAIELVDLTKHYSEVTAVDHISLQIAAGELVSLLGPSGCGKTTTLNMIAGFIRPDGGDINLHGQSVIDLSSHKRNCGMVFQSYALFPHMSVFENVAFGLRVRGSSAAEIESRVGEVLTLVQLEDLRDRSPNQLSGGQRQRVSLARALAYRPGVLLLDEPFSNLDAKLRVAMRSELVEIQRKTKITSVFVTHDQEEAMHISDRIIVMNQGRIEQVGKPEEVYRHPDSLFVADFLGEANLIPGKVKSAGDPEIVLETDQGLNLKGVARARFASGDRCWLMVRPEHLTIVSPEDAVQGNCLKARVKSRAYLGSFHTLRLEVAGHEWSLKIPDAQEISAEPGDDIMVSWTAQSCVILHA